MTEIRPKVGEYALFHSSSYGKVGVDMRRVAKVTPTLVKFEGTMRPRQCSILSVVASFESEEVAKRVRDSIGGVAGEYNRRRRIAEDERSARIIVALTAAKKQVAAIVAAALARRNEIEGGE